MKLEPAQIENLRSPADPLRRWVEAETGMDFSGNRVARLCEAVRKVWAGHKLGTLAELPGASPVGEAALLERLTAEVTVGESFFFRNEHHFRALREHVLPEMLRERAEDRELRIWSAGCAGGEEPYSLAILLDQILTGRPGGRECAVSILGTDLNPEFLARARQASYRLWSFRQTKIHEDQAYFSRAGDSYRLTPRVREWVRFAYLNLVKDVYPSPLTGTLGMDLIVFRNVAIYLRPEVTRAIIARFHEALRPGGWLLLGEVEVSLAETDAFETRRFEQATFFQKRYKERRPRPPLPPGPVLMPVMEPRPVASGTSRGPAVAIPVVPELPEWVPLPKRTAAAGTSGAAPAGVGDSAAADWQRIERLVADRKFDDATAIIDRIAAATLRAQTRLRFAQCLLASAEVARARRMLDRCLLENPLLLEAQLLQAGFAEEAGHLDQAEKLYRRALYIERSCPMAHFHLALVQQQRGDAAGARRSLKTTLHLIERQPPHSLVEYGEGVCHGRLREMATTLLDF